MKSPNRIFYVYPYSLKTGFVSWEFLKLERELVYSQNACSNKQGGFDKIQMTKSKSARKSLESKSTRTRGVVQNSKGLVEKIFKLSLRDKNQTEGGSEGGLVKDHTFPLFFDTFPYFINCCVIFLADRGPYWVPFPKCGVLEMVHNNRYSVLNQDS